MSSFPHLHKRILVTIPSNGSDGHSRIEGIFQYANEHARWQFDVQNDLRDIELLLHSKPNLDIYDGIIAGFNTDISAEPTALIAFSRKKPIVLTNESLLNWLKPNKLRRAVLVDNEALGREAARYFKALGHFAVFAFYLGRRRYPWAGERLVAYRETLADTSEVVAVEGSPEELVFRLQKLPRPIALFAANDRFANDAINACLNCGLRIPGDIMVLGCDNDRILCDGVRPRITSLEPDFAQVGYRAALTLDRLMRHRGKDQPYVFRVTRSKIVERESARPVQPATVLVDRAVNFVAANACRGIGVKDVAHYLGASRSLLDLRFRQLHGRSIHQEILDARFARLTELLRVSTSPIGLLARECGFNSTDNLMRQFKKRYGCTMCTWRTTSGTEDNNRSLIGSRGRREVERMLPQRVRQEPETNRCLSQPSP